MDSNTFLLGWAFLATCGIGYFQSRAIKYKKHSTVISFLLCEVACGEVKPEFNGSVYTVKSDGVTFTFERKKDD